MMPKLIFHSFIALMLVVSCECKDMHIRRMPEEKDIAFKGEVKKPKKSVCRKGESRAIQVHSTSSDEEAKDTQFKILSATLADGSPADLDYTSLKLGDNTLSYTPKGPGTHALTIKVAVEGEEENAQTIHYTLEAPAANWQVEGRADATGNLTLQIEDVPEELQGGQWRITNTTWSRGLEGNMNTPTSLQYGTNSFSLTLDQAVRSEPWVRLDIEGPDAITKTCQIDLMALCMMQLSDTLSDEKQSLIAAVNATDRFGKKAWEHYFGEVDEEPALPDNINEVLNSDCPFCSGRKIRETHLLVMIPTKVSGKLLTPSQMIQLAQKPQKGTSIAPKAKKNMKTVRREDRIGLANALRDSEEDITTRCLRDLARKGPSHTQPYWILMTRDTVAFSGKKIADLQNDYPEYDLPTVLEASTVILTHYVSTEKWLYERTHTYCKETVNNNDRSFFIGKSNRHNKLIIDNKMRTAIKMEGGDAPSENIPYASRGQGLLRRL